MVITFTKTRIDAALPEPAAGKPSPSAPARSFNDHLQGVQREPAEPGESASIGCYGYDNQKTNSETNESAEKHSVKPSKPDSEIGASGEPTNQEGNWKSSNANANSAETEMTASDKENESETESDTYDSQAEAIAVALNGDEFVPAATKTGDAPVVDTIEPAEKADHEQVNKNEFTDVAVKKLAKEATTDSAAKADSAVTNDEPVLKPSETARNRLSADRQGEPAQSEKQVAIQEGVEKAATEEQHGRADADPETRSFSVAKQQDRKTEDQTANRHDSTAEASEDIAISVTSADKAESHTKSKLPQRRTAAKGAKAAELQEEPLPLESRTQRGSAQGEPAPIQVAPLASEIVLENAAPLETELFEGDESAVAKQHVESPVDTAQRPTAGRLSGTAQTEAAPPSHEAQSADPTRFVGRVARALQSHRDGEGQIRLRLSPPELGSLRLEVSMKSGVLTARIEAETPAARHMLMDNLPALRDRLAEQNIKVGRLDVDLMDASGGGSQEASSRDSSARRDQPAVPVRAERIVSRPSVPFVRPEASRAVVADGRLNVVV